MLLHAQRARYHKKWKWIYRFWANPGRPWGGIVPPSPVLAPGSALGSRPRVALSSAQAPSIYSGARPLSNSRRGCYPHCTKSVTQREVSISIRSKPEKRLNLQRNCVRIRRQPTVIHPLQSRMSREKTVLDVSKDSAIGGLTGRGFGERGAGTPRPCSEGKSMHACPDVYGRSRRRSLSWQGHVPPRWLIRGITPCRWIRRS
jgi:hypothetical protein